MDRVKTDRAISPLERLSIGLIPEGRNADLADLLDLAFEVPEEHRFFDDFPIWSRCGKWGVVRMGAFDQGRLVGSACIRVADLKFSGSLYKVGIIGAVATNPNWRKLGIAGHLISKLEELAREQSLSALFLWSGDQSFYFKRGYELAGIQTDLPLSTLVSFFKKPIKGVQAGWSSTVMNQLLRRKEGVLLHPEDEEWISKHKNVQWLSVEGDRPGYIAYGRGIDLGGYVHQWGGHQETVLSLLGEIWRQNKAARIVGHPSDLIRLGLDVSHEKLGFQFLCKILSFRDFSYESHVPYRDIFGPKNTPNFLEESPYIWFWGLDGA